MDQKGEWALGRHVHFDAFIHLLMRNGEVRAGLPGYIGSGKGLHLPTVKGSPALEHEPANPSATSGLW